MPRLRHLLETSLVFAVLLLQGAWPVPEVNEPNYVGKAVHFWNPQWAAGDFFLNTADSHLVFYWTFGWLSMLMSPVAMAWTLRLLAWALMAWGWQRLSAALVPRPWMSPLTAAVFLGLVQHFNVAGEWIIGGAEAKAFSYGLVLLGLAALVRGQWSRTWILLGAASAMHVLVGGWSIIAAAAAAAAGFRVQGSATEAEETGGRIAYCKLQIANCKLTLPAAFRLPPFAFFLAAALVLLGAVPPLALDWGTPREMTIQAHVIYVFERLPHHLNPMRFPVELVLPFLGLCVAWFFLCQTLRGDEPSRPLRAYVTASLAIAAVGVVLGVVGLFDQEYAAGWLRFYWFRLADIAVPLGVALLGVRWAIGPPLPLAGEGPGVRVASPLSPPLPLGEGRGEGALRICSVFSRPRVATVLLILLAAFHLADCAVLRLFSNEPLVERVPQPAAWQSAFRWLAGQPDRPIFPRLARADRLPQPAAWLAACRWVAQSDRIPANAIFITPRMSQTFKWYAHRGEVASFKEVPQDSAGLVAWWERMQDVHGTGHESPLPRWYNDLADAGAEHLRRVGAKYGAGYALIERSDPLLPLPVLYENSGYVVYKIE